MSYEQESVSDNFLIPNVEIEQTLQAQADRLMGLDGTPISNLKQQFLINKFLNHAADVIKLDASNVAAVDVKVIDTSATVTAHIVKAAPVPVAGSLVAIGGNQKVVLEAGDKLNFSSVTANSDVIISLLETT